MEREEVGPSSDVLLDHANDVGQQLIELFPLNYSVQELDETNSVLGVVSNDNSDKKRQSNHTANEDKKMDKNNCPLVLCYFEKKNTYRSLSCPQNVPDDVPSLITECLKKGQHCITHVVKVKIPWISPNHR